MHAMDEVRKKLREELDITAWRALRTHLCRDSVILVTSELDLVEVACCVALDRTPEVAAWIADGRLRKPTVAELASWERDLEAPFRLLIVAPYLLIQPV
jgi:hypothetical protein